MTTAPALDTTIAVVTPENIAFEYQLAGPFQRLPAYAIDVVMRLGVVVILAIGFRLVQSATQVIVPEAFFTAALMVSHFLISWLYGALLEAWFNGRTIGKWACGLRVISVDGRPITGTSAVIRNFLRTADMAPYASLTAIAEWLPPALIIPTGIVGLVCTLCTRRMQRLGDLAAGTMVVLDERAWRLPLASVDDPRAAALASYIPADYRVSRSMARTLATYVERRVHLTPARRREVARTLTDPLLQRFGFRPDIDPDLLMIALYHGTFLTDPRGAEVDIGVLAGQSPLLPVATVVAEEVAAPIAGAVVTPQEASVVQEPHVDQPDPLDERDSAEVQR